MTTINNMTSKTREITCGVPQGSILGPLLFLVYVNDLSSVVRNCKYQLYADDTVIYHTHCDIKISKEMLEGDLNRFTSWCRGNVLTVNVKKSKYVLYGLKSQTRKVMEHTLLMKNVKLDRVSS